MTRCGPRRWRTVDLLPLLEAADIVIAYVLMAYVVMAYTAMAYVVMAYIVTAYIIAIAYIVMAYAVMAYSCFLRRLHCVSWRLGWHDQVWPSLSVWLLACYAASLLSSL